MLLQMLLMAKSASTGLPEESMLHCEDLPLWSKQQPQTGRHATLDNTQPHDKRVVQAWGRVSISRVI